MTESTNTPTAGDNGRPIEEGSRVTLHYRLSLADDTLVDSSHDGDPQHLVIGSDELVEGLEALLIGLRAGESASFQVAAWQNFFGDYDDEMVQELDIEEFPDDMTVEPDAVVAFTTPSGEEIAGLIREISGSQVTVDFNHPLVGHDFVYEVEILDVQPKE